MPTNKPQKDVRRTNVYVDSWNLYYGCLRDTPHRWINVAELVRLSMPDTYHINRIRFFTARVIARPNDPQGPVRQEMLFRAMQTLPNLTMHYGNFLMKRFWAHLITPLPDGTKGRGNSYASHKPPGTERMSTNHLSKWHSRVTCASTAAMASLVSVTPLA